MPSFLLRFESRAEASVEFAVYCIDVPRHGPVVAMLDGQFVTISVAFGDGIARDLTGETADFEGETLALTQMRTGFHLLLTGPVALPPPLLRHIATVEADDTIASP